MDDGARAVESGRDRDPPPRRSLDRHGACCGDLRQCGALRANGRLAAAIALALAAFWAWSPAAGAETPDLDTAAARIAALRGVRAVLVHHRGETAAELYNTPEARGAADIKSASKSLLSALVGIALARGELRSLEQPVAEALAGVLPPASDERKRGITIRHLLTMNSGLESTSEENYGGWVSSENWLTDAWRRPMVAVPGETFVYSTGNSHLLSAILTVATGQPTLDYARRRLLDPLGARITSWQRDPQGYYFGGNGVAMAPPDLLRFGLLYLQGGRWEGEALIPEAWVRESTSPLSEGWPDRYGRYGYLWWVRPEEERGAYAAVGFGGQFLYIAPASDTVVVVTATEESKGAEWDRELLRRIAGELVPALVAKAQASPSSPP